MIGIFLWVGPVFIVVMILVVGFFAGVETGLFSVSRAKIRRLAERNDRRAAIIATLLEKPEYFIGTALVGINLAHVSLAVVSSYYIGVFWVHDPRWTTIVNTVVITPLVLFFGEVIPKTIFRLRPHAGTLFFARAFRLCYRILKPITNATLMAARILVPGGDLSHEFDAKVHRNEILSLVRAGEKTGVVEDDEKQMIESVFELSERTVREVMTPRVSMVCFARETSYAEMLERATIEKFTRYPVYEGTPDRIVGLVHVADLLDREHFTMASLRTPMHIPESAKVDDALEQLRSAGRHMAVVVDEYGGTAGVVTIEDFLEELVGEIDDEHDDAHAMIIPLSDDAWAVDARADLDEVAEIIGLILAVEPEDVETVGGFVLERMGRIPKAGDEIREAGHVIKVLAADDRRVIRVEITRSPTAPPE